jgi:hypothetical protein
MKPSGALLPLLALGALVLSAEAAPCRPDNTNTTVTVKSKKFYCTESLDSLGCNIGKVVLKVDVESSCRSSRSVDLLCDADLKLTTRSVGKVPDSVSGRQRIGLDHGRASEKIVMTWRELGQGPLEVDVAAAECRIDDGNVHQAPEAEMKEAAEVTPETVPEAAGKQVIEPAAQPASRPTAAPAPSQQQKLHPEMTHEAYQLQLLREQNRARELEIRALELKLRLKEMEQNEK